MFPSILTKLGLGKGFSKPRMRKIDEALWLCLFTSVPFSVVTGVNTYNNFWDAGYNRQFYKGSIVYDRQEE
jgi:hypothetical protein